MPLYVFGHDIREKSFSVVLSLLSDIMNDVSRKRPPYTCIAIIVIGSQKKISFVV
jgi:hypothetical protein